ncbi:hypothetical protein SEA_OTTERSTEDTS21_4 [Gordonia phage OtterstedtS21]|uniref:SGNH hydrolase-type esterase domain-containing protein n=1 Tax=Gordonia phage OtterstedtS21 TaxID=2927260 RepID=A0A9E7QPT7_9CAUD|nr:hypothetical protein SEA_OTTERSTEDTS21_4 [Gordonia phage OtterstedtS21]
MANVWYIGEYDVREVFGQRFDKTNGWSINESAFTGSQLTQLNVDSNFLLGQPSGPRVKPFKADSINGPDAYLKAMQDTLAASEAIQDAIPGRLSAEAMDNAWTPRFATYQAQFLGRAMKKLRNGEAVKIVARGDSITYGHDTVSPDVIAAPTETLPDGTKHSFTRSPAPWPLVVQNRLNETYPGGLVTVENQGYSGDWVQRGYNKWPNNVGADITIISYGTNDASASGVPEGIRGNLQEYVWWLEKMIIRDLTWGSAVVLLPPMRQRGHSPSVLLDSYRNATRGLATAYGIPYIETEELLATAPWDCWSDGNHLNTKGNNIVGSRLAAAFVGEGPLNKKVVGPGSKLLPRPTLDNVVYNGAIATGSTGYATPRDTADGQGTAAGLSTGVGVLSGTATWSFYTENPDVALVAWSYINPLGAGEADAKITYELDYGVEQGQNHHVDVANFGQAGNGDRAASSVVHGPLTNANAASYRQDPLTNPLMIRVATPGWHTIRAKFNRMSVSSIAVTHMIEAFDWRTLQQMRKPLDFSPVISALSAVHVPVPASYNESTDITETKVNWPGLTQALGVKNWADKFYQAPALELTVRTYGRGYVKYVFIVTQRPDQAGADVAQRAVGTLAASESSGGIAYVAKLGVGVATITTVAAPETDVDSRELAGISYEASTQSLVFAWRTINSGNSTAKNMKKNFVMTFRLA